MRSMRSIAFALIAALALASCSRDPNVAKKRYLDSGDKYFSKARYREASIQYRNAIKIDPRYAMAYYKLGLAALKNTPPGVMEAVRGLRRAKELLPPGSPESLDTEVKLAELYLSPVVLHNSDLLAETEGICADLLKRDPNSFDGHRLTGDLDYLKAMDAYKDKNDDDGRKFLDQAAAEYHKADSAKPGDKGVTMQIARVAWRNGDTAGAEQGFRSVLDRDKTDVEAYRELYLLLWGEGKHPEAEQILKSGYQNNPKQYRFLIWLAEQYMSEGRRDDMLGVLSQIESKSSEYPRAFFDVGDFYLRVGDGDSAVKEYKEGISKDPKNKTSYEKRIIEVLMRQGKQSEVAAYTGEILKDNPKDADAREVQATIQLDKGDVVQALPELQQVVTASPNNPVAHYNLGRAYFAHGEIEQARQQLARAIELRPDYISARLSMAQLQVNRQEYDAAVVSSQEILKYDPNNAAAKLLASAAMLGQKKFGDSRAVLDQMLKTNPSSAETVFELGVVSLAEKKYAEAEQDFRRSYQLNPASPRGLMGIAETYMEQDQPEKAIQLLQGELAKTPSRLDLHLALGDIDLRSGNFDAAVGEYQKVLAGMPAASQARGSLYLKIGEAQRRKGDFSSAISSFQEARKTQPDNPSVLTVLAISLNSADRWNEARQIYEATMKLDPNNGVVLNNLAFGLAEHNQDLDQALTMAQQAKRILPTMPEVSDTLAWIYLKKNLPDEALNILQDLVQKDPSRAVFHYHLALAMAQKGNKTAAKQEAQKALSLNPTTEEKKTFQDFLTRLQ